MKIKWWIKLQWFYLNKAEFSLISEGKIVIHEDSSPSVLMIQSNQPNLFWLAKIEPFFNSNQFKTIKTKIKLQNSSEISDKIEIKATSF